MILPRCLAVSGGLTLLVILAGCERSGPAPAPPGSGGNGPPLAGFTPLPPAPLEESEPHAAGKKVFNATGCTHCHTVKSAQAEARVPPAGGPPMAKKGPDLSTVAAKPGRDAEWFIAYVSNPVKVNPDSRMPPFGTEISAAQMRVLAEFLADLK
jgi:mono/diheme cytochrome c family protein